MTARRWAKTVYAFDEYGRNLTGLQYSPDDQGFYYFNESGYGIRKKSPVETVTMATTIFFQFQQGKKGQGYNGERAVICTLTVRS
ncbi:MAG: hypothetical protein ACLUOI_35435 [Eisenbergiella sp.]